MTNWTFAEIDKTIAEEIESFLPQRLFDIHVHLYRKADLKSQAASVFLEGPEEVTAEVWRNHIEKQIGSSKLIYPLTVSRTIFQNLGKGAC